MKVKSVKSINQCESVIQTMSKITRVLLFVTVCFLLNPTTVSSQGWGLSDSTIQVMKEQYSTTDNDTLRLQSAWGLSLHYVTSQRDSARRYFQASYEACTDLNYPLGMAWSSSSVGLSYYLLRDYKSAYQWITKSKSYTEEIKVNVEHPIFEITNVGNVWANQNEALCGLKALNEQITGHIYSSLGMNKEALGHHLENLSLIKNTSNTSFIGRAQWNVGTIYLDMDELEEAEHNLLQANKNIDDNDTYKGGVLVDLASLERLKGNQSLSLAYIQESFKFSKKNSNYSGIADGHHALGRYYYDQGDYDKSIEEYNTADEIDRKIDPNYKGYASMLGRAKCYKEKGELAKAYALNTEGQRLKAEYEIERKERINAFHRYILEQKDTLQEERIEVEKVRSQRRTIGFSIAGLLLSLIGLLLYRNNRQKQKSNELLSVQKVELENTLVDLKATQTQLVHSEKMASLGELTAGIAHEIQNPLNFVNNFSEVSSELLVEMKEELESGDKDEAMAIADDVIENLEKITHHGKRADSIVKGMLQHSRTSDGKKEATDINALCDEFLRLSYHGLRAKDKSFNADFTTKFDDTIGLVEVRPQEMGRVILNLITNAFYAVSERKKNLPQDTDYLPKVMISTHKESNVLRIKISDNGIGIPEEIKNKIFQPFFTTKPTGEGTGLGLSMSYDIIKSHGGQLLVQSPPAEQIGKKETGTEFIIQLPIE